MTPEQVVEGLASRGIEAECTIEELEHGIRHLGIEDPHGSGLPISMHWMSDDHIALGLGHGTTSEWSLSLLEGSVVDNLVTLMVEPSTEDWSRNRHTLVVGEGANRRRFVSTKGIRWRKKRTITQSYLPYRRQAGDTAAE